MLEANKRLSRILAEGLTIVLSILFALGAEAWWSERSDRQDTRDSLSGLLVELGEARVELELYSAEDAHLRSLTEALEYQAREAPLGSDIMVADTLLVGLLVVGVADPPTAMMEAFSSADHFDEVVSPALMGEILSWGPAIQDMRDDQIVARNFVAQDVLPYLESEVDLGRAVRWRWWIASQHAFPQPYDTVEIVSVRVTLRLRNLLALKNGHFDVLTRQSTQILARLDKLEMDIRRELGGD